MADTDDEHRSRCFVGGAARVEIYGCEQGKCRVERPIPGQACTHPFPAMFSLVFLTSDLDLRVDEGGIMRLG